VVPIQTSKGGPSSNIGGRKGKPRTKNAVAHKALSREDGSTQSNKRAPPSSSIDTAKKTKRDDDQVSRPDHDEVNQGHSENRSSRSYSKTTRGNDFGGHQSAIKRNCGAKGFQELLLNTSVLDFLNGKDSAASFASFAAKVSTCTFQRRS
jgi:hypothetical protein